MTDWNPNDTPTLGPEWFPHRNGKIALDSSSRAIAMSMVQSAAEQISYLTMYVDDVNPGTAQPDVRYPQPGIYGVEVFDNEDAVVAPSSLTTLTAVPNEDVSGTGTSPGQWLENTGTSTTIYSEIDDTTETEWITNGYGGGYGVNTAYVGRMSTGGLTLTNRRILAVRLRARVLRAFVDNYTVIVLGLNIGSADYYSPPINTPMSQTTSVEYTWRYNPATKRPWTIADVQAFDTTDEWSLLPFSAFGAGNVTLYYAYMEVVTCPETRLALGSFYNLTYLNNDAHARTGGASVALVTPAGAAWTKDASGRHLYVVRRLSDDGALTVPTLDASPDAPPSTAPTAYAPTLDPTYGYVSAMGSPQTYLWSLGQYRSTAVFSVDSQPYSALVPALVFTGQDAEQEVSGAAATNYNVIKFLVKPGSATASLVVTVKRRSDNVVFGSTFTIAPANVRSHSTLTGATFVERDDGWWLAQIQLATPATLAAATQYYIEFSSSAASGAPWSIALLDSRLSHDNGATIVGLGTYNDATDRATANGSELDRYDLAATISTPPATPTSLTATLDTDDFTTATVCGTSAIPYVHLTWAGLSTAAQQVERSSDGGVMWDRIAELPANAAGYMFDDFEGRFGSVERYRVRQIRPDGAVSDWTAPVLHTKSVTACPTLFLVSNYDPSVNTMVDYAPGKELTFLEADEVVFHNIYGRDGRLSAQPIEERGLVYRLDVIVAVDDRVSSGGQGMDAFDPIRAIARALVPHVTLVDHYGVRAYVTLRVPSGSIMEAGGRYHATLEASTWGEDPYVVTAQTPVS